MKLTQNLRPPKQDLKRYQKQFLLEKRLRKKLLFANSRDRRRLYRQVYDEFFAKVAYPTHRGEDEATLSFIAGHLQILRHVLRQNSTFLEVGPGDCSLALAVSKRVRKVYAVDVSPALTNNLLKPKNFHFLLSDGVSLPLENASVDVAFSSQVLEHLHPDDVPRHLKNIYNVLTLGGVCICITPNRLSGPHDVSQFFADTAQKLALNEAEGLHLKEYTVSQLEKLFLAAGFTKVQLMIQVRGKLISYPTLPTKLIEKILTKLPRATQKRLAKWLPFSLLLGILMIAKKGKSRYRIIPSMAKRSTFFSHAKQAFIRFSRLLAKVQIFILLTLFYYLILAPFAIAYKLASSLKKQRTNSDTYWINRPTEIPTREKLMKQY